MSIEGNKAVVRRFIDAYNKQDHVALRETAAPELAKMLIDADIPQSNGRV
jgi:hypothetical protein